MSEILKSKLCPLQVEPNEYGPNAWHGELKDVSQACKNCLQTLLQQGGMREYPDYADCEIISDVTIYRKSVSLQRVSSESVVIGYRETYELYDEVSGEVNRPEQNPQPELQYWALVRDCEAAVDCSKIES